MTLNWQSPLDLATVFKHNHQHSFPCVHQQKLLFLSQLSQEDGRNAVQSIDLMQTEKTPDCLSKKPFNLRSNVNEYGGKSYWLNNDKLYFVNAEDQHLYCQSLDNGTVQQISPENSPNSLNMFVDLQFISDNTAIAVCESAGLTEENLTTIVAIDLNTQVPLTTLQQGDDFYANLCLNQDKSKLAWISWNHPNMPWDDTQLWIADIQQSDNGFELTNKQQLFINKPACYGQLCFADNQRLFFVADFKSASQPSSQSTENYANIYCYDIEQAGSLQSVTQEQIEYSGPHWQYGDTRLLKFDEQHLLAIGMQPESSILRLINSKTLESKIVSQQNHTLSMLSSNQQGFACMMYADTYKSSAIASFSIKDGLKIELDNQPPIDTANISVAQHIEFPTSSYDDKLSIPSAQAQETAYGFYYPPKNQQYTIDAAPPLLIMVHGGPTSRAFNQFDLQKQFWTTRGFAILDINHRGSTGYGRDFRDALYGFWGDKDADDIQAGANYLIEKNLADKDAVFIRGKSAGGYAVLRALTRFPDLFAAGACYYGIGNLVTLAEITHKFEKHYTDSLVGEAYNKEQAKLPSSKYQINSPINYLDQLKSPMILFQGLEDKVVPPAILREVAALLNKKKIDHQHIEFTGEGHGFHKPESNIKAWKLELAFYQKAIN